MKKLLSVFVIFTSIFIISGCSKSATSSTTVIKTTETETSSTVTTATTATSINYRPHVISVDPIVTKEEEADFNFFWDTANTDTSSPGYGLIPDRYPDNPTIASIASVGYGLTAIPIGIENGWITYQEGYDRVLGTLHTISKLQTTHGFYFHFLNMSSGARAWDSEVSIIDTAIMMNGILFAGQYFGGQIEQLANQLYQAVQWNWYFNSNTMEFYMGYTPENGFYGAWTGYAEQLMIYVLAAGSNNYSVPSGAYYLMKFSTPLKSSYADIPEFYASAAGTMFTYQFSQAWIDFRNIKDKQGTNWFENSVYASKAAIEYAESMNGEYKTLSDVSWGLTASDGPNGYNGSYGNLPNDGGAQIDGTVAPCGAIGSIVFTPQESIAAMKNYATYPQLWGTYGFVDAYNLGTQPGFTDASIANKIPEGGWFDTDVIGIDKGVSLLMIENYRSDFVWNVFMNVQSIKDGLNNLQFSSSN